MTRARARLKLVSVGTVMLFAATIPVLVGQPVWLMAGAFLVCLLAAAIATEDLLTMLIPDLYIALLALLAAALVFATSRDWRFLAMQIGVALLCALALFAFAAIYGRVRGQTALGFGDVKLVGAAAILIGPWGVCLQLVLASVAGILFVFMRSVRRRRPLRRTARIPFGTFLAPAMIIVWAWFPLP